ncbi:MAG: hypothetical protein C0440_03545 [Candidatus Pelagibacter sp.]|nr:hypothetical protein [Candidatus Pelagibacter sp.]
MQYLKKINLSIFVCTTLSSCIIQPLYKNTDSAINDAFHNKNVELDIVCSKLPLKVCSRFKSQLAYKMKSIDVPGLKKIYINLSYTTGDIAISEKAKTFRKQSQLKVEGFSKWEEEKSGLCIKNYNTPIKLTKVSSFGVDPQMEWASHMAEESRLLMLIDPLVENIMQAISVKKINLRS